MNLPALLVDFETRSRCNLKDCGADAYFADPSTEVLTVGWADTATGERGVWCPLDDFIMPEKLVALARDPNVWFVSMGDFDFVCWNRMYPDLQIPYNRFLDLQALAGAMGLPNDLETVAMALGVAHQKDMAGHTLMMKLCKPGKDGRFHMTQAEYDRLAQYCDVDVVAEAEIYQALHGFSIPSEYAVHALHTKINAEGMYVDMPFVRGACRLVDSYLETKAKQAEEQYGVSTNSRKQVLEFATGLGYPLPGYTKTDVAEALEDDFLPTPLRRVLEARQLTGFASVKKYNAFLDRVGPGDRLRNQYKMNGAVRTGRWSGAGVQPQNFARGEGGLMKIRDELIQAMTNEDILTLDRLTDGRPLAGASTCLRNAICAEPGNMFVAQDYSAIEARLVLWEAEAESLSIFSDYDDGTGPDPYKYYASLIFGIPADEVTKVQRMVGKTTVLGCGFGMGPAKFLAQLLQFGVPADLALAVKCVKMTYRAHNPEVADFHLGLWGRCERAALAAIQEPGISFRVNTAVDLQYKFDGKHLTVQLPSGRKLYYFDAGINPNGKYGKEITYMSKGMEDGKFRDWHRDKTYGGKLVENITQAISADLTRDAMLRIDAAGLPIRMHSHDEIMVEVPKIDVDAADSVMSLIMCDPPAWAAGLPVAVAGWVDSRFIKD